MPTSPAASLIPPSLDARLVAAYRGWDALERTFRQGSPVIDFDLAGEGVAKAFLNRQDVVMELQRLKEEAKDLSPKAAELVQARLQASLTFLQALDGDHVPLKEYIENTLAITPVMFDEAVIEAAKRRVAAKLQEVKVVFDESAIGRFQSVFTVLKLENLPQTFEFYRDKWLGVLTKRIVVSLEDYVIRVEFASENAYWRNWISGDLRTREILLRINIHPRNTWYHGSQETLVLHEYCGHAVQMVCWHQAIQSGELPNFYGILTVHFPDQFLLEGLAESIAHILPGRLDLEKKSKVLLELQDYGLLVMNNVHIMANENGKSGKEEALRYGARHLPFTPKSVLNAEIADRTGHPIYRTYQYVYGFAKQRMLHYLNQPNRAVSEELLRTAYRRPMTARQWEELASALTLGRPRG